ncbi:MAG: thermonuclease family protein [Candidatus Omnitrophica bacterium]|nr:thermonuclease family protein [Candidatus Omnitrophota bacterium]
MKKLNLLLFLTLFCYQTNLHAQTNFEFFFSHSKNYDNVLVKEVISAERLRLESGEKVQLIGVRVPQLTLTRKNIDIERDEYGFIIRNDENPETPIEEKAYLYVKELLENQYVRLEFDEEKKSENFDTYAYVYLTETGLFVNEDLLKKGFAFLRISPPNLKYETLLRQAYQQARNEFLGVHNK